MAEALLNQDLSIKDECKLQPVFTTNGSDQKRVEDLWAPLTSFGIKKKCPVIINPRACRSHVPTQGCLSYMYTNSQEPPMGLLLIFKEHGNWDTLISMQPYKKQAVHMAMNISGYSFVQQDQNQEKKRQQELLITKGLVVLEECSTDYSKFTSAQEWNEYLYQNLIGNAPNVQDEETIKFRSPSLSGRNLHDWVRKQNPNFEKYHNKCHDQEQELIAMLQVQNKAKAKKYRTSITNNTRWKRLVAHNVNKYIENDPDGKIEEFKEQNPTLIHNVYEFAEAQLKLTWEKEYNEHMTKMKNKQVKEKKEKRKRDELMEQDGRINDLHSKFQNQLEQYEDKWKELLKEYKQGKEVINSQYVIELQELKQVVENEQEKPGDEQELSNDSKYFEDEDDEWLQDNLAELKKKREMMIKRITRWNKEETTEIIEISSEEETIKEKKGRKKIKLGDKRKYKQKSTRLNKRIKKIEPTKIVKSRIIFCEDESDISEEEMENLSQISIDFADEGKLNENDDQKSQDGNEFNKIHQEEIQISREEEEIGEEEDEFSVSLKDLLLSLRSPKK